MPATVKLALVTVAAAVLISGVAAADSTPVEKIAHGIKSVLVPADEKRDGILTVHDDNLYVQCLSSHFLKDWRCEAAGLEGQPWLSHVITPARQDTILALGFKPDAATGNFVAMISRATSPEALAGRILQVMKDGYGAEPADLVVAAERMKSAKCHRRIRANAELGGLIGTPTIGFAKDAGHGCGIERGIYDALNYDDPTAVMPKGPGGNLEGRYVAGMALELARLKETHGGHDPYAIFEAGPAYVQCIRDEEDKSLWCEAASDDAVGRPLERILTPDRRAKLIAAGFAPPGKVMNFHRMYPFETYDMTAVAKALLTVLETAYGYEGEPPLTVKREDDRRRPVDPTVVSPSPVPSSER